MPAAPDFLYLSISHIQQSLHQSIKNPLQSFAKKKKKPLRGHAPLNRHLHHGPHRIAHLRHANANQLLLGHLLFLCWTS